MNLKSKLFGFGAATVLSLSMMSGAMAADDRSVSGTATLIPANGGVCSVSFAGSDFNFGEWQWDGKKYTGSPAYSEVNATVVTPDGSKDCTVTLHFDGLHHEDGARIDATNFSVYGSGPSDPGIPTYNPIPVDEFTVSGDASTGDFSINMRLNKVQNNLPSGNYTGDLEITDVTAQ